MKKALGIAAVIAAALAVYLLWGSSSSSSSEDSSSASSSSPSLDSESARPPRGSGEEARDQGLPRPLRMSGEERDELRGAGETRRYIRDDGTIVRDHRGGEVNENYERRVTLPKALSPVQPETLAAVRMALRPAMLQCIATHAPDAPEGSSAQAVLTVSIQDELLKVDKLELSTEGLAEDEELKGCIREVMLGHEQIVSGTKDVEAHTMTFPYDL